MTIHQVLLMVLGAVVARQAQVPGEQFVNNTQSIQAQVPGGVYLNEG